MGEVLRWTDNNKNTLMGVAKSRFTPLKFNSEFTPEKWWLEDDPFL